jgi:hypothetical protein
LRPILVGQEMGKTLNPFFFRTSLFDDYRDISAVFVTALMLLATLTFSAPTLV